MKSGLKRLKSEEFGHWEIDTVIGKRAKEDPVILSLVERQTRNSMFLKVADKTAHSISEALLMLQEFFGSKFDQVFKTITADNGYHVDDVVVNSSVAGSYSSTDVAEVPPPRQ